jgi:hypothetical protein
MKNSNPIFLFISVAILTFQLVSCTKNETRYYADAEIPGLGIFSNTGNNLMTCYANDRSWRTADRRWSLFGLYGRRYEVYLSKRSMGSMQDTLMIDWYGYYADEQPILNSKISLWLFLPHGSLYASLSSLGGKRLHIDSTTGLFTTNTSQSPTGSALRGSGDVYFQTVRLDSLSIKRGEAIFSGLFEADFGSIKISRGRFDHAVSFEQVSF